MLFDTDGRIRVRSKNRRVRMVAQPSESTPQESYSSGFCPKTSLVAADMAEQTVAQFWGKCMFGFG